VLDVVVAGRRRGGIRAPRQRREPADHRDGTLQFDHRLEQRQRIGRRRLMHRQPCEREAGDVHFFDRAAGVLEAIDRCFRDQLEPGGAELFEQGAQRDAFLRRELLQIGEREARHGGAVRRRGDFADAGDGGGAVRGGAGDPQFARGRGTRYGRPDLGHHVGDAHKSGPRAVALPA
jgi:hypothetical protein